MPGFQAPDGRQTHHHGLLAGASAGAMAVLLAFGLVLLAWHRIAGAVGGAVIVIVWTAAAVVIAGALAFGLYAVLWLRHRVRHPEILSRHAVRAEAASDAPEAIPASQPAGELPAGGSHTHYHFDSAEAVEAALQAMQERQITESNHDSA
jgi:hypothetical protein